MTYHDRTNLELTAFWTEMAHKLFRDVNCLYEQIETHYSDRTPDEGPGPQMMVGKSTRASGRHGPAGANKAVTGVLCLHLRHPGVLSVQISKA